jgi:Dockerin type I domain/Bacterial Ig-like domain (group 2)
MKSNRIFSVLATAFCAIGFDVAWAQSNSLFTVVSPAQNEVFAPGVPIPIRLQPAPLVTLASITVSSSIGLANVPASSPPSLTAPQDPFGPVVVAISAQSTAGGSAEVDVTVDIESPQMLSSITVIPATTELAAAGTSSYLPAISSIALEVLGTLADRTQHNITASTKSRYASSNSLVATVDSTANVTSVAPGKAQITVRNTGNGTQTPVAVQVPVSVNVFELRGDLDGDSDVDVDDIAVVTAALNTPSTGPGDPRDLNGDGKIDSTDVSLLRALCSRPNCATQ